jgi:uncharacterized protein with beta-barrel porin domain
LRRSEQATLPFPGIQPNSGHRDYSRLNCDVGDTQLGPSAAKNSALTSAGAELRLANGVTLIGKFDGEFASRSSTYAGTGAVRYAW